MFVGRVVGCHLCLSREGLKRGGAGCVRDVPGRDTLLLRALISPWPDSMGEKQDSLINSFTSNPELSQKVLVVDTMESFRSPVSAEIPCFYTGWVEAYEFGLFKSPWC